MVKDLSAVRLFTKLRDSPDRLTLMEAAALLPAVAFGLRWIGLTRLQSRLGLRQNVPGKTDLDAAQHHALLVDQVARRIPFSYSCLHRSLTLGTILRRRELQAELVLGVRRTEDGDLAFHAWVEHGGQVLNDHPDVRKQFRVFDARETQAMESNGG